MIFKYCRIQSLRYANGVFSAMLNMRMPERKAYLIHDMTKPTKWVCAKRRLRSDWASAQSAQSDQSFHCPHEKSLGPKLPTERRAKTDQTGRMPRLIWVFAGRTVFLLVLSWRGSFGTFFIYHSCSVRTEISVSRRSLVTRETEISVRTSHLWKMFIGWNQVICQDPNSILDHKAHKKNSHCKGPLWLRCEFF